MRPRRQPCSSATGDTAVAPAATARSATAGVGDDEEQPHRAPPTVSGLRLPCAGASSATQNVAPPAESGDTTASCSSVPPTRVVDRRAERGTVEVDRGPPAAHRELGDDGRVPGGSVQALRPRRDVEDVGLAREDLRRQHAVDLVVGVRAGVVQDRQAEVEVGGGAQGGEHDTARRDPAQHEVLDRAGAQDHVEVAAREGAHPALRDDGLVRARRDARVDRSRCLVDQPAGVAQRREGAVARAHLGVPGPEADADEDDPQAGRPRGLDRRRDARDDRGSAVVEPCGDPALDVHDEQRGGGRPGGHDAYGPVIPSRRLGRSRTGSVTRTPRSVARNGDGLAP